MLYRISPKVIDKRRSRWEGLLSNTSGKDQLRQRFFGVCLPLAGLVWFLFALQGMLLGGGAVWLPEAGGYVLRSGGRYFLAPARVWWPCMIFQVFAVALVLSCMVTGTLFARDPRGKQGRGPVIHLHRGLFMAAGIALGSVVLLFILMLVGALPNSFLESIHDVFGIRAIPHPK